MDLNGDGIKEVVYSYLVNVGNRHTRLSAQVLEWNGQEFRELVRDDPFPYSDWRRRTIDAYVEFKDIDGNGTQELVFLLDNGVIDCEGGGPYRSTFYIWMWDGEYYQYMWEEWAKPLYRFEAAHDGDYFASIGLYDRAETMYLRAVFDESLKPGSDADWRKDGGCPLGEDEKPDTTEPPRIRAYARFRLVELFTRVGRVMEAESHRSYLRTNYPLGNPGYIYAYLANTFWWEYVKDENISAACAAVIRAAEENEKDVFGLFEEYGYLNPGPMLENICPFSAPSAE